MAYLGKLLEKGEGRERGKLVWGGGGMRKGGGGREGRNRRVIGFEI